MSSQVINNSPAEMISSYLENWKIVHSQGTTTVILDKI